MKKTFLLLNSIALILFAFCCTLKHGINKETKNNHNLNNSYNSKNSHNPHYIHNEYKDKDKKNIINSLIKHQKTVDDEQKNKVKVIVNNDTEDYNNGLSSLDYGYTITYNDFHNGNAHQESKYVDGSKQFGRRASDGSNLNPYYLGQDDVGADSDKSSTNAYVSLSELFNIKIQIKGSYQPNTKVTLDSKYKQLIEYQALNSTNQPGSIYYSIVATGILSCPKICLVEHWIDKDTGKKQSATIGQYGVYNFFSVNGAWAISLMSTLGPLFIIGGINFIGAGFALSIRWSCIRIRDFVREATAVHGVVGLDRDNIHLQNIARTQTDPPPIPDNVGIRNQEDNRPHINDDDEEEEEEAGPLPNSLTNHDNSNITNPISSDQESVTSETNTEINEDDILIDLRTINDEDDEEENENPAYIALRRPNSRANFDLYDKGNDQYREYDGTNESFLAIDIFNNEGWRDRLRFQDPNNSSHTKLKNAFNPNSKFIDKYPTSFGDRLHYTIDSNGEDDMNSYQLLLAKNNWHLLTRNQKYFITRRFGWKFKLSDNYASQAERNWLLARALDDNDIPWLFSEVDNYIDLGISDDTHEFGNSINNAIVSFKKYVLEKLYSFKHSNEVDSTYVVTSAESWEDMYEYIKNINDIAKKLKEKYINEFGFLETISDEELEPILWLIEQSDYIKDNDVSDDSDNSDASDISDNSYASDASDIGDNDEENNDNNEESFADGDEILRPHSLQSSTPEIIETQNQDNLITNMESIKSDISQSSTNSIHNETDSKINDIDDKKSITISPHDKVNTSFSEDDKKISDVPTIIITTDTNEDLSIEMIKSKKDEINKRLDEIQNEYENFVHDMKVFIFENMIFSNDLENEVAMRAQKLSESVNSLEKYYNWINRGEDVLRIPQYHNENYEQQTLSLIAKESAEMNHLDDISVEYNGINHTLNSFSNNIEQKMNEFIYRSEEIQNKLKSVWNDIDILKNTIGNNDILNNDVQDIENQYSTIVSNCLKVREEIFRRMLAWYKKTTENKIYTYTNEGIKIIQIYCDDYQRYFYFLNKYSEYLNEYMNFNKNKFLQKAQIAINNYYKNIQAYHNWIIQENIYKTKVEFGIKVDENEWENIMENKNNAFHTLMSSRRMLIRKFLSNSTRYVFSENLEREKIINEISDFINDAKDNNQIIFYNSDVPNFDIEQNIVILNNNIEESLIHIKKDIELRERIKTNVVELIRSNNDVYYKEFPTLIESDFTKIINDYDDLENYYAEILELKNNLVNDEIFMNDLEIERLMKKRDVLLENIINLNKENKRFLNDIEAVDMTFNELDNGAELEGIYFEKIKALQESIIKLEENKSMILNLINSNREILFNLNKEYFEYGDYDYDGITTLDEYGTGSLLLEYKEICTSIDIINEQITYFYNYKFNDSENDIDNLALKREEIIKKLEEKLEMLNKYKNKLSSIWKESKNRMQIMHNSLDSFEEQIKNDDATIIVREIQNDFIPEKTIKQIDDLRVRMEEIYIKLKQDQNNFDIISKLMSKEFRHGSSWVFIYALEEQEKIYGDLLKKYNDGDTTVTIDILKKNEIKLNKLKHKYDMYALSIPDLDFVYSKYIKEIGAKYKYEVFLGCDYHFYRLLSQEWKTNVTETHIKTFTDSGQDYAILDLVMHQVLTELKIKFLSIKGNGTSSYQDRKYGDFFNSYDSFASLIPIDKLEWIDNIKNENLSFYSKYI